MSAMMLLIFVAIPLGGRLSIPFLIVLGCLEGIYILKQRRLLLQMRNKPFYISLALWCIWNFVIAILYMSGMKRLIQCVIFAMTTIVFSIHGITNYELSMLRKVNIIMLVSWYLYLPFGWGTNGCYQAYMNNPNILGVMILGSMIITLIVPAHRKRERNVLIMAELIMLLLTNSRATIITVLILFASLWILRNQRGNISHKRLISLFGLVLVSIIFVVIIYPSLYKTPVGELLNNISMKYSNKRFFSGRQIIWPLLIEIIKNKLWIGYGLEAIPSDFLEVAISSHNLYIQTMLQSGVIGLALLMNIFYKSFYVLTKNTNKYSVIVICYLLSQMVHQCFEVGITQNNWHVSLCFWVFVGIGISGRSSDIQKTDRKMEMAMRTDNK